MKSILRHPTLCALLGASIGAHAAPVLIPNGDFSIPAGANFGFFQSAADVVSFPATGGSGGDDGGYGLVNNTLGSWGGGLVSPPDNFYPGNQGIPLSNLGLVAGNTYTFSMDMKNFAGTGTGGLKVESWNGGANAFNNTGDMPASASSSEWATYTWNYLIPVGATSIKIVPLLTGNSGGSNADSVGFDNIKVNNTPVPPPPFVPDTIINGDFEIAGGAGWAFFNDGTTISYPTTGGNPDGNAVLDATVAGNFGVLVAFNNAEVTAASLGLTPGQTYTFQVDMKILDGAGIGGLRLEGPSGFAVEERPAIIGDGSEWATYSMDFTLQNGLNPVTQFKLVALWGINSKVAYDNFKILPPPPSGPLQASIIVGTSVSWAAASAENSYQPQQSADNSTWTNLGPAFTGNAVNAVFDASTSPFYRVLESEPSMLETVYNGSFSEQTDIEVDAEGWNPVGSQLPTRLQTGGRGDGGANMQIKAVYAGTTAANSEIQQNTNAVFGHEEGEIVPGNTYSFSFWAKQISSGVSYVQQFKVSFLNSEGAIMGDGGWRNFSGPVAGDWTLVSQNGLVAPAGSSTALIQIFGATGAVAGGLGEVLIDDVSLESAGFGSPTVVAAATLPAVEISWPSKFGQDYQVRSSLELVDWSDFGGVISGDNSIISVYDTVVDPEKFYVVGELP